MFNPEPRIQVMAIGPHHACCVIDDALRKPEKLVAYADAYREDFAGAPRHAYPGCEMYLPESFTALVDDFFRLHLRRLLGARRTLRMESRLAMVTRAPDELGPPQWLCRRDRLTSGPDQRGVVAEAYLFHDAALGGTHFFLPRASARQTDQVLHDARTLPADAFTARHGLRPGYPATSNEHFEHVLTVPAKWNRMVFHGDEVFHAPAITHPGRLPTDPRQGRLTLRAFFTCSRNLVPW
jgi:hypothetical protein